MKNDLPLACIFQISLTINSESTWPGLNVDGIKVLLNTLQPKKSSGPDNSYSFLDSKGMCR